MDYDRTPSAGLDDFTADYLLSSSFVVITAMPEPSTLMLAGLGATVAVVAARRHRAA